ncbi:hypothetical protein [Jiulongibacter sp. NS-SX5]|uniref:hypothetical protein n=1 Tax=Jiulongibacter sp. NS-SX5 TaxID=3463854 RepID=UPI0040588470
MIEINMTHQIENPALLENLKQQLDGLGVNSFTACFETHKVTLTKYHCLTEKEVECSLRKNGFECKCTKLLGLNND